MRSLHVAVVIPGFAENRFEPGLPAIVDLVERVADRHRVTVVALHYPKKRSIYRFAGARVVPLALHKGIGWRGRAQVLARGPVELLRQDRRAPVDVVHAMWADEPGAVAVLAAPLLRARALVSVFGGELVAMPDISYGTALGRGGRWTTRIAFMRADALTVGSRQLLEPVQQLHPRAQPELTPLGVDTDVFRPADAPDAPDAADAASHGSTDQVVLLVGSLTAVKDPLAAVRVFERVAATRPRARLVLCGEGPLRRPIERLVVELGLGGRVDLPGHVARSELVALQRTAAALIVTSRHEGQHVAAIEAAASAVPVVGYAVGALPDLNGGVIVTERGDELALAAALGRVLDDAPLAQSLGKAGRAAVLESYDVRDTTQRFLEIYARLARRA